MVYSIDLVANNLSPFNWSLPDLAAVVNWGSVTQQPQPVLSGQTNVPMGRYEAARGTWTGTDGVVFINPDGFPGANGLQLGFGVKMPFVGDNQCVVGIFDVDWFFRDEDKRSDMIELTFSGDGLTSDQVIYDGFITPNGNDDPTPSYHLWCTIGQGTQVTANFYMTKNDPPT